MESSDNGEAAREGPLEVLILTCKNCGWKYQNMVPATLRIARCRQRCPSCRGELQAQDSIAHSIAPFDVDVIQNDILTNEEASSVAPEPRTGELLPGGRKIKVLSGDFVRGSTGRFVESCFVRGRFVEGYFVLKTRQHSFLGERISFAEIILLSKKSERNERRGVLGWGLAGVTLAGSLGLVAGAIYGGQRRHEVTFILQFADGRKLNARTDNDTFDKMHLKFAKSRL